MGTRVLVRLMGPISRNGRRRLQDLTMQSVFPYSNLHSRLLMEENLIKKKSMTLQQESKEVQADWAIIHQRLVELNLSGKDEQENSNLETPEYQVETNNSVRL